MFMFNIMSETLKTSEIIFFVNGNFRYKTELDLVYILSEFHSFSFNIC